MNKMLKMGKMIVILAIVTATPMVKAQLLDPTLLNELIAVQGSYDLAGTYLSTGKSCFAEVRSSAAQHTFSVAVFDTEDNWASTYMDVGTKVGYGSVVYPSGFANVTVADYRNLPEPPNSYSFSVDSPKNSRGRVFIQSNYSLGIYADCRGERLPAFSDRLGFEHFKKYMHEKEFCSFNEQGKKLVASFRDKGHFYLTDPYIVSPERPDLQKWLSGKWTALEGNPRTIKVKYLSKSESPNLQTSLDFIITENLNKPSQIVMVPSSGEKSMSFSLENCKH